MKMKLSAHCNDTVKASCPLPLRRIRIVETFRSKLICLHLCLKFMMIFLERHFPFSFSSASEKKKAILQKLTQTDDISCSGVIS